MNVPSFDIKTILTGESGWNTGNYFVGIGNEPPTPNNTITIYDVGAAAPMLSYDKTEKYEYLSIQIRVRGIVYKDAYQVGASIRDLLHGQGQVTVDDSLYTVIKCTNGPVFMDIDINNRFVFILNFNIQRRPTPLPD